MTVYVALNCLRLIRFWRKPTTALCNLSRVFFYNQIATNADFPPPIGIENIVEFLWNRAFIAASSQNVIYCKVKPPQALLYFAPLQRETLMQYL